MKARTWIFPSGKITKGESNLDCTTREVREETGFDTNAIIGSVEHDDLDYLEVTMRGQNIRLYIVPRVPLDTIPL